MSEKLVRVVVPAVDEILGVKYPVLDKGFVRVVDYMGGDSSIVQAARVSYGKGTKSVSEDEGLIRYLLRHSHTTPFEMCEIKFHIRMPMDCWRQHIRHRTASVNEYSTRYSEAIDDKQVTAASDWRLQSGVNKQGSSGYLENYPEKIRTFQHHGLDFPAIPGELAGEYLTRREKWFHTKAGELYQERLSFGIAKEQARKDLPLSTYTEAYWKIDLHNLMHFLSLRMDSHAQLEIRSYANAMGEILEAWCPLSWAAFNDYNFRRNALLLSVYDKEIIRCIVADDDDIAAQIKYLMLDWGWYEIGVGKLKTNRERSECEVKLATLGLSVPWLEKDWTL